jgi:leucyl-tRNA synthetase
LRIGQRGSGGRQGLAQGANVERRKLKQWFFAITRYADDLIDKLSTLKEWPEKVVTMQENWIGKSQGLRFHFPLTDKIAGHEKIEVFTTRPDTIFGASFVALSPGHPLTAELAKKDAKLQGFVAECNKGGTAAADIETAEKMGFDTGLRVPHPFVKGQNITCLGREFRIDGLRHGRDFRLPGARPARFGFCAQI